MFDALENDGFALLVAIIAGLVLGTILSGLFVWVVIFGQKAEKIDD